MGILALYYAIPTDTRVKLSVLAVDYLSTIHGKTYPQQILEGLETYRKLFNDGYENINMLGNSAGGNLALIISRIIAYPDDAKHYLSKSDESILIILHYANRTL